MFLCLVSVPPALVSSAAVGLTDTLWYGWHLQGFLAGFWGVPLTVSQQEIVGLRRRRRNGGSN